METEMDIEEECGCLDIEPKDNCLGIKDDYVWF